MVIDGYALVELLGEGAAAKVWRARSPAGTEVALKLMSESRANRSEYRRSFRREAEAMARLRHPNIVTILNIGFDEHSEQPRPWLAMELVEGTLDQSAVRDFESLRGVLLDILDGLAHAHGRGILHRDLKPSNVLERYGEFRCSYQLADFGIAHPMGVNAAENSAEVSLPAAGTPLYMAPEQVTGEWRNWGPWTDLYAVGVLAWELATGVPPFVADDAISIARMHLEDEPQAFKPRFEVPGGFEDWLRRLLRKQPYTRYERAADAAWRLAAFEEVAPAEEKITAPLPTRTLTFLDVPTMILGQTEGTGLSPPTEPDLFFTSSYDDVPPVPSSWRLGAEMSPTPHGLGLLGLRATPLIGREDERDELWNVLRQTHEDRNARFVALASEPGGGATTLARWFAHRADELGAAMSMWVDPGPDGLRRSLSALIGAQGMSRTQLWNRLHDLTVLFGRPEAAEIVADGVTDILTPEDSGGVYDRMFRSPSDERFAALTRLLRVASRSRPLIVVFDDLHESWESTLFVDFLLRDRRRSQGLLLVATVDDDWERRVSKPLPGLMERSSSYLVRVSGNGPDTASRVIESLVPLDETATAEIVDAVDNRVLEAVTMLFYLAESEQLRSGADEQLLVNESLDLPRLDLSELWLIRFVMISEMFGPEHAPVVERAFQTAAAFGRYFSVDEWREATDVPDDDGLLERVLDVAVSRGLLRRQGDGVVFEHASARQALITALEHDPAIAHEIYGRVADAAMAAEKSPFEVVGFLRKSGRNDEALEFAMAEMRLGPDDESPKKLWEIASEILVALDAEPSDPRWGDLAVQEARHSFFRHSFDEYRRHVERAREAASRHGWEHVEADLLVLEGDLEVLSGSLQRGYELVRKGYLLAAEKGDEARQAMLARDLVELAGMLGRIEEAEELTELALSKADVIANSERFRAWVEFGMGAAYHHTFRYDDAAQWWTRSLEHFRACRERPGVAASVLGLGQVRGSTGELQSAIRLTAEAFEAFESIGSSNANVALLANLTYRLYAGKSALGPEIEKLIERLEEIGHTRVLVYGYLLGIAWASKTGSIPEFERWYSSLPDSLVELTRDDPDVPRLLEIAVESWEAMGDTDRAARCSALNP